MTLCGLCLAHGVFEISVALLLGTLTLALAIFGLSAYSAMAFVKGTFPTSAVLWTSTILISVISLREQTR